MNKVFLVLFCSLIFSTSTVLAEIEVTVGKPLSPTDRLNNELSDSDVEEAFVADAERMLEEYTDDPNSCLGRKQVGTCKLAKQLQVMGGFYFCRDLYTYNGLLEETIPMYSYYVPFQKTETVQVPYDTGYMTKDIVKNLKAKAEEFLHAGVLVAGEGQIERLEKVADKFGMDSGALGEFKDGLQEELPEVITDLQEFKDLKVTVEGEEISMEDSLLRPASSKNGRFMEMHVFPTGFDTNETNREQYFVDIWTHQGAVNAWVDKKNPVPIWFSEFPESLMTMRFQQYARNTDLGELLKAEDEMDTCRRQKQELGSLNTLFPGEMRQLIGNDDKCAPSGIAFYGPLFSMPLNFDRETIYAPQAATKRDFNAIKLAFLLGKTLGVLNPDSGETLGNFHDVQFQDDGEHKRDRMQFLDLHREPENPKNRSRNVNEKYGGDKGCMPNEQYYLPNIKAEEYGDANINTEGERFTTAHYRFIQACPVCYLPVSNETIFY